MLFRSGAVNGSKKPLFHTSFFPLLMQVNFLSLAVIVWPNTLQVLPGFGVMAAWAGGMSEKSMSTTANNRKFRITSVYEEIRTFDSFIELSLA